MTALRRHGHRPRHTLLLPGALALLLALGVLLLLSTRALASEADVETIIRDAAVRYGVDPDMLVATARCESRLNPYAVGSQGEMGLFQVHPRGLLWLWREWGYGDLWDPAEQADFAARAFAAGLGRNWSCAPAAWR